MKSVVVGAALAALGSSAYAALAQIQMGGMDISYNEATGEVCDNGGGIGCFGAADSLDTMTFRLNGVALGTYLSNINFNLLIGIAAGTAPTNGTYALLNSSSDVFDAQINSGSPGLFTDVSTGNVTFSNNTFNMGGTGFASVFAQALPFGLVAGNPLNWSFSSGLGSCDGTAGSRICTYSGTGEISWVQNVPEPASLALVGLALLGLAGTRRRQAA